jgi:DNA-binding transcriptional regulator YhcF (GntR family)
MAEFTLKLKTLEAVKENTKTLLDHYKSGGISKEDILELREEAINDEEYEVAISIKEVLDYIQTNK